MLVESNAQLEAEIASLRARLAELENRPSAGGPRKRPAP
jgi:hypothetical protein